MLFRSRSVDRAEASLAAGTSSREATKLESAGGAGASGLAINASDQLARKGPAEKQAEGSNAPDGKGGKFADTGSLAEKLRMALNRSPASLGSRPLAGSGLEEERLAKKELAALIGSADSHSEDLARAKLQDSGQRFTLSGSETDAAVHHLTQGAGSMGDSRVFGNSNQSIFQRMSQFLQKAQQDKRVTTRNDSNI